MPDFTCPKCRAFFTSGEGQRRNAHLYQRHGVKIEWVCPGCPYQVPRYRLDDLRKHIRRVHPGQEKVEAKFVLTPASEDPERERKAGRSRPKKRPRSSSPPPRRPSSRAEPERHPREEARKERRASPAPLASTSAETSSFPRDGARRRTYSSSSIDSVGEGQSQGQGNDPGSGSGGAKTSRAPQGRGGDPGSSSTSASRTPQGRDGDSGSGEANPRRAPQCQGSDLGSSDVDTSRTPQDQGNDTDSGDKVTSTSGAPQDENNNVLKGLEEALAEVGVLAGAEPAGDPLGFDDLMPDAPPPTPGRGPTLPDVTDVVAFLQQASREDREFVCQLTGLRDCRQGVTQTDVGVGPALMAEASTQCQERPLVLSSFNGGLTVTSGPISVIVAGPVTHLGPQ